MISHVPNSNPIEPDSGGNTNSVNALPSHGRWLIPLVIPANCLTVAGSIWLPRRLQVRYATELAVSIATGLPWLGCWEDPWRRNRVALASDILDRHVVGDIARSQGRSASDLQQARRYYDLADPSHYTRLVAATNALNLDALIVESPGNRTVATKATVEWLLRFPEETNGAALIWVVQHKQDIESTIINAVARNGGRACECSWSGPTVDWADWEIHQPRQGLPRYGVRVRDDGTGRPVSTASPITDADGYDFSGFFGPGPAIRRAAESLV